ncbi:hypothetical protein Sste5346_009997 [Sporothrix stenoceras]|uniref:xylan 1,4-beta-xylosidase n=1 Tax=Sporothrix stenoceras TaxID=5173 RepID=A0ABR3YHZ2_9PEZI
MPSFSTALLLAGAAASPAAAALLSFPDCVNGPLANNTVCNTKASPSARAAALVKAMTIDEKLVNLVNTSPGAPRLGLPPYEWWSEALHGVAGSPGVTFNRNNGNNADFAYATSFASPITLSAAFDDDLVERVATIVSTEARAFSNAGRAGLDFWTPNINPYKDPRWGRGAETPGEDPFRIKGYVRSLLRGLEGPYVGGGNHNASAAPLSGPGNHGHGGNRTRSAIRKVIATCKHFAAYDLERWNGTVRYGFDAIVSLQDLSEYYLPAFQQCARDSHVGSIMCSYNAVNGTPACASTYLMTDILREHWGWTDDHQYVTSDCNAVLDFDHEHAYTKDGATAAAAAYSAGTDTVCEVPSYTGTDVAGAYNQSLLSEAVLDRALTRLYEGLVRVGYFDPADASPYRSLGWKDVDTPAARSLAKQSAADGLVLKKNDGLLPLSVENKTVALIGHWADATRMLLGGYSGTPPYYNNPAAAAAARNWSTVVFGRSAGAPISNLPHGTPDSWTRPALELARKADIILYFGGTDLSIAAEDKDRDEITLPGVQLNLVRALSELGKPLVVVQLGDQTDDTPLLKNSNVSAILWAGYPGQDGGNAVLDVITGVKAPAGRLPVTQYPGNYTSAVPMTDMALRPAVSNTSSSWNTSTSAANPGRTYRWFNKAVLPFGHGLHYTTFAANFTRLVPSAARGRNSSVPTTLKANNTFNIADVVGRCVHQGSAAGVRHKDLCHFSNVDTSVTNTGNVTSDFVALAFLSGNYGPAPFPLKTLAAYRRIRNIAPGKTATTSLSLSLSNLARTDAQGNLVLYPGEYTLLLDEPTQSTLNFVLTGDAVVLDEFPQPK